jgi:hypothetical protein
VLARIRPLVLAPLVPGVVTTPAAQARRLPGGRTGEHIAGHTVPLDVVEPP